MFGGIFRSLIKSFIVVCCLGTGLSTACIVKSLFPSIGFMSSNAVVTIEISATHFLFPPQVLFGSLPATVLNYSSNYVECAVPTSLDDVFVMVTVENCTGALVFQYFDESKLTISVTGTFLRSSGGSSVGVSFAGLELQSWTQSVIRLTQLDGSCVGYSTTYLGKDLGNNTIRFTTDSDIVDDLCGPATIGLNVSLNGFDWIALNNTLDLIPTDKYEILFVYIGKISDFGWTYAHNVGRVELAQYYGLSMITHYIEGIPSDEESMSSVAMLNSNMDMIVWTSEAFFAQFFAVAEKFLDVQFILISDKAQSDIALTPNSNIAFATLYQARYLSGVIAGGMLRPGGRCCYIKAYDESAAVNQGMNAFISGLRILNPEAEVLSWSIGVWRDPYTEMRTAHNFLERGCELLSQHSNSIDPQQAYVDADQYAIGSNTDTRVFLGELLLTSPVYNWFYLFVMIAQEALDGRIGSRMIVARMSDGAVELESVSGLVPESVKDRMEVEKELVIEAGDKEYIFCGPMYDEDDNLRIPAGYCYADVEVSEITWPIQGVEHLGEFVVQYPVVESQYIPEALTGFMISVFTLLSLFGVFCAYWTYKNKKSPTVVYAQPFFLYLLIVGCIVGLSSLVPMSVDPGRLNVNVNWNSPDVESKSIPTMDSACQAQIWLLVIGFALSFPTLFVKSWRLYKIFSVSQKQMRRFTVKVSDCCIAVAACLLYMLIICAVWQGVDPLRWSINITERDTYGNPIQSYGVCTSDHSFAFLIPIVALIVVSLVYGNYLCFQCRTIQTLNEETKWISLCMVNFLQVSVLGIPLLLLQRDDPIALLIVKSAAVIAFFGGTLGLIFMPKIMQPKVEVQNPLPSSSRSTERATSDENGTSDQRLRKTNDSSSTSRISTEQEK